MDSKIFDTLLEPTFIIDEQRKIHYCNETAAIISDVSARKLVRSQMPLDEVFKFNDPVQAFADLANLKDASPYQELKFTTDSGKEGRVQITLQPISDSAGPRFLVFFRDVTLEDTLQKKYQAERAELEKYTKNLEVMVEERTAEVKDLNRLMKALLDSLHQGFFVFNREGKVLGVSSKACQDTIECDPRGKMIWDVLKVEEKQTEGFKKWMETVFSEMLPFDDLAPLGPAKFPHSNKKTVKLEYFPLRSTSGGMEGIGVVATDISNLIEAQRQTEIERAHARMIISIVKNKRQVAGFLRESEELLAGLNKELKKKTPAADSLFRYLHTLKGNAALFSVRTVAEQCHVSETLLAQWKSEPTATRLDSLRRNASEIPALFEDFVCENNEIIGGREKLKERWVEFPISDLIEFQKSHLPNIPGLHSRFSNHFIMEPIANFFTHYNNLVESIAEREGKLIAPIKLVGGEIKIIPEIYENLLNNFVHSFRNAIDHGIELPADRAQAGKPELGQIEVVFDVIENNLQIAIKDDGAGIDPNRVRAKLREKGLRNNSEPDEEVIQHVFDSNLSTKDQVTDISGRGVGMDAILSCATALGGKAWVKSKLGVGTTLFVEIPYVTDITAAAKTVKKSA